ncbi:MAG: hypothetical protein AB8G15_09740 [Saprospiraceae bacterium]
MIWSFRKSKEECVRIYLARYDLEVTALERIKALPQGLYELDWSVGQDVEQDYFFSISCRKKDLTVHSFYVKMTSLLGLFATRFRFYERGEKRMKRFDMGKHFEHLN